MLSKLSNINRRKFLKLTGIVVLAAEAVRLHRLLLKKRE